MINKSTLKTALMAFSLMLIFTLGTMAQKVNCSTTTDEQIINSIYVSLNKKYEKQISHINVRIKDGTVTVEGWVTTKNVKKDIEKIAKKTSCVKNVVNTLSIGVVGGCGPGEKPCGSICIPQEEACNIKTKGE